MVSTRDLIKRTRLKPGAEFAESKMRRDSANHSDSTSLDQECLPENDGKDSDFVMNDEPLSPE